jgi:hypothetical protein
VYLRGRLGDCINIVIASSLLVGLVVICQASIGIPEQLIRAATEPSARVQIPHEWRIEIGGQNVSRDVDLQYAYSVANRFGDGVTRYVKYGERDYGINLVWTPSQFERNFRFSRPSAAGGLLQYGERVAIYVDQGGYLKYGDRKYGINLVWSNAPVYEWEIRGEAVNGQRPGTTVQTQMPVGLYNSTRGDYVAYCSSEYGINLRWASDCDRLQIPATVRTEVSLKLLSSSANPNCPGQTRVIWTLHASGVNGNPGLAESLVNEDHRYNTPGCYLKEVFALAEGTWDITVQTPGWNTTCQRKLVAPNARVDLIEGKSGCFEINVREH